MKRILFLVIVCCFHSSFSQTLKTEKGRFYIDEERSTLRDFVDVMKTNQEAYDLALKAKSSYDASTAIGFVGGFLIGWPIGTAIGGGDPNWGLAAAGAGVLVIAIPIMSSANKKMDQALDIYNGATTPQSGKLDLKIMPSKVGFVYSF